MAFLEAFAKVAATAMAHGVAAKATRAFADRARKKDLRACFEESMKAFGNKLFDQAEMGGVTAGWDQARAELIEAVYEQEFTVSALPRNLYLTKLESAWARVGFEPPRTPAQISVAAWVFADTFARSVSDKDALAEVRAREQQARHTTLLESIDAHSRRSANALEAPPLSKVLRRYLERLRAENQRTHLFVRRLRKGTGEVEVELDRVYTTLRMEGRRAVGPPATVPEEPGRLIEADEILVAADPPRAAVVGGPGTGKSTFLSYLAWRLAALRLDPTVSLSHPVPEPARHFVPVLLPLRYWTVYKGDPKVEGSPSLRGFLLWYIRTRAGLSDPECRQLLDFALSGHAHPDPVLLLFDGVDEIPDPDERAEFRSEIETLLTGLPRAGCVVTTRRPGWLDAPFGGHFTLCELQLMSPEQVGDLVRHWLDQYPELGQADEVMGEIQAVEERRRERGQDPLIRTPLMTNLAVSVRWGLGSLPPHRSSFFKAAVDVILNSEYGPADDLQGARRALANLGGTPARQRVWLAHLALAMHESRDAGPATEDARGRVATEAQVRAALQTLMDAEALDAFITAIRVRGHVLVCHEDFEFVHFQLQEYLAAECLADCWRERTDQLGQWLLQDWWREPLLLLMGILDSRPREDLADVLLTPADANRCLAGAELLATALLDLPKRHPVLETRVRGVLAEFHADDHAVREELYANTQPTIRAASAAALARLGDPRESLLDPLRMEFCFVPAGPFFMGSRKGEEDADPDEIVADADNPYDVQYGYWIGCYPVTNAQFDAFTEEGGYEAPRFWRLSGAGGGDAPFWTPDGVGSGSDRRRGRERYGSAYDVATAPVVGVSWYEAVAFAAWLSERLPAGWEARLPSEPEWEKAARGGVRAPAAGGQVIATVGELSATPLAAADLPKNPAPRRRYPWGGAEPSGARANFGGAGIGSPSPVGCFPGGASVYGCEELSGNVWEWTRSLWIREGASHGYPYPVDPDVRERRERLDGPGPRVLRGGAWFSRPRGLRCAFRAGLFPVFRGDFVGFRVVVSPSSLDSDASGL